MRPVGHVIPCRRDARYGSFEGDLLIHDREILLRHGVQRRLIQICFNPLTDAVFIARHNRAKYADGKCLTCGEIGNRRSAICRWVIAPPGIHHHARHRLDEQILPRHSLFGQIAVGTPARAAGIDDFGVGGFEVVIAQPEPVHDTGAEVLDNDITIFGHLQQSLAPFRAF